MTLFHYFMVGVGFYLLTLKVTCSLLRSIKEARAKYAYHYIFSIVMLYILLVIGFIWALFDSFTRLIFYTG